MQSNENQVVSKESNLSIVLEACSLVLLGVFVVSFLVKFLPLKLTEAQWQLGVAAELVNNGLVALAGVLLLYIALEFNKNSKRIRKRRNTFKRWAPAAVAGFLLLVPLQVFNTWRIYQRYTTIVERQISQSTEKLTQFREVIATSTSHMQLQERLQAVSGKPVVFTQSQLGTPLSQLKYMLLQKAEKISGLLQQQIEYKSAIKPDRLISETFRVSLTAVLYAIGFAFIGGLLPLSANRRWSFGRKSTKRK
jgi:hypothetical protein